MLPIFQLGASALANSTFIRSPGEDRSGTDKSKARLTNLHPSGAQGPMTSPLLRALAGPHWKGGLLAGLTAFGLTFGGTAQAQDAVEILNVSYDPTREFYREYNELFTEWWTAQGNAPVTIRQSHGGSGAQARAVIDGLEATGGDAGALRRHRHDRRAHGQDPRRLAGTPAAQFLALHLDHRLPRARGQPEGHRGLGRPGRATACRSITPNPKTSGGARWNFLAAWAYAEKNGHDPRDFVGATVQQRAGARHRCARLDDDLHPARHRRRAAGLGERGLPRARRTGRGRLRHRRALGLDPGRAAGGAGRRQHHIRRPARRRRAPISNISTAPRRRRWRSSTSTGPGTRPPPRPRTSPAFPR